MVAEIADHNIDAFVPDSSVTGMAASAQLNGVRIGEIGTWDD